MGWVVKIGEGSSELQISADINFNLSWVKNLGEGGRVDSVDYVCSLEGNIVKSTAALVADDFVTYSKELTEKFSAARVKLDLDGTTKFDWQPSLAFSGPHVIEFRSVPDEGNGESNWLYAMTIFYKAKGGGGTEPDLYEFQTSLSTMKDHNRVIRKIWKASGKAATHTAAKARILTYKPSGSDIQEEVGISPQEARAFAAWVWEALQETFCSVTYEGGGEDFVDDGQAGNNKDAVLHKKLRRAVTIKVDGYVLGYTLALKPPARHFQKSATMREVTAAPRIPAGSPEILDEKKGIYRLPFHEVWMSTGPTPAPVHAGGHNAITFRQAPADGKIASSK